MSHDVGRRQLQLDRLPSEEIVHFHPPHTGQLSVARQYLRNPGQDPAVDTGRPRQLNHTTGGLAGGRRHGDQDFIDHVVVCHAGQVFHSTQYM
jgi:hypothetical protein